MSIAAYRAAWEVSGLSSGAKLTLLAIAEHANDSGWAWPSIERLAVMTGVSTRQATRNIQALEDAGVLQVDRNSGRGNVNRYRIVKGDIRDVKGDIDVTLYEQEKVTSVTEKVTSMTIKGDIDVTQNRNEPIEPLVLVEAFTNATGFFAPDANQFNYDADWRKPLEAIKARHNGNAERAIVEAVGILRKKRYTITSPRSILKTALNWQPGNEKDDWQQYQQWLSGAVSFASLPDRVQQKARAIGGESARRQPVEQVRRRFEQVTI